jgi:hypothetical protein
MVIVTMYDNISSFFIGLISVMMIVIELVMSFGRVLFLIMV